MLTMTQGLYAAASGVRANQVNIDVISNNISNINTWAFKGSRTNFATVYNRTLKSASSPTAILGGVNPAQLGTGTLLAEVVVNHGQGGTQFTGRSTDLTINGEGFFVVQNASTKIGGVSNYFSSTNYFTRAGNLNTDYEGNLVTASGNKLVGTSQASGSNADTTDTIKAPLKITVAKLLDANGKVTGSILGSVNATAADFAAYATTNGLTPTSIKVEAAELNNLAIGAVGALTATYSNGDKLTVRKNPAPNSNSTEILHLPVEGPVFAAVNTTANGTNGKVEQLTGALAAIVPDKAAVNPMLGASLQIQMVTFPNKNGLEALSNNGYVESANTGPISYGIPSTGSRGTLLAGSLETSNVDLASEFTNLVVAQRGLEANSKMVKAQSEAMQTILNAVN